MIEYEKKGLLNEIEYNTVINKYPHIKFTVQHNYYYDTDDLNLNSRGITCRIRKKDNECEATVKRHKEQETDKSTEEDVTLLNPLYTKSFAPFGVPLQGELVTERTVIYIDSDCEAVLDKNIYLGCTDYELEVEYTKDNENKAKEIINDIAEHLYFLNIISSKNDFLNRIGKSPSKSARFFERRSMKKDN